MWGTPRCKVEVFLNLTLVLFYVQIMQTILLLSIFLHVISLFIFASGKNNRIDQNVLQIS